MSKKSVFPGIQGQNSQQVENRYPQVTGTDIFNTRMLTGGYEYYSIRTRGYPYPLYSNLNLKKT